MKFPKHPQPKRQEKSREDSRSRRGVKLMLTQLGIEIPSYISYPFKNEIHKKIKIKKRRINK